MRPIALCLLLPSLVFAQQGAKKQQAATYVSKASRIVGEFQPSSRDHSPQAMARAATVFLDSLGDALRKKASHKLVSPERREWTNLPARPNAGGVRLGDCSETQVKAFCDLMATLFSKQGYDKMRYIMLADDQLLRGGRPRAGFGAENFSVVVFGKPSPQEPWGFQLDGHHVGVNLAIEGEKITMSPSFIGTQPEAFHLAMKKIRPLAGEVDTAFQLVNSFSREQIQKALISDRRGRIVTGPGADGQVPQAKGVSCATFSDSQRKVLLTLISQWINDLPPKQAAQRMSQIKGQLDQTHFAWNGPTKSISDVSYTIQGPTMIIEYACQDIGGNPVDHLHTMYRDPTNEYGKQLAK